MEFKVDDVLSGRTPRDVYVHIKGRRAALLKALTTDAERLYEQCDPEVRENLCLYGYANEEWRVGPSDGVPADLPEPVTGINYAREGMERKAWLSFVAAHCDSWLLALANFLGSMCRFSKYERNRVFDMMNSLPTLAEVVSGTTKKEKEKASASNERSNKSKSIEKGKPARIRSKEEDEKNICGACGDVYKPDEFWICCDSCEKWFHGKCVKVNQEMAELIDIYECPSCTKKKAPQ